MTRSITGDGESSPSVSIFQEHSVQVNSGSAVILWTCSIVYLHTGHRYVYVGMSVPFNIKGKDGIDLARS